MVEGYSEMDPQVGGDYFQWLCGLIGTTYNDRDYLLLLKDLARFPFFSIVEHDENREADGLELREIYVEETRNVRGVNMDASCSMLEMMIALAHRMAFETSSAFDSEEDQTRYWFWTFIRNLELLPFSDNEYQVYGGYGRIFRILERFVRREYTKRGKGGLFPLKDARQDQRGIELWYQMGAYLNEVAG